MTSRTRLDSSGPAGSSNKKLKFADTDDSEIEMKVEIAVPAEPEPETSPEQPKVEAAPSKRTRKAAGKARSVAKATEEGDVSMSKDDTVMADQTVAADDKLKQDEEDVDPVRTERLAALGGWNNGNDREEEGDTYPHGTLGEAAEVCLNVITGADRWAPTTVWAKSGPL